jgi:tight adherence protein C
VGLPIFIITYMVVSGGQTIAAEAQTVSTERQGILLYISPILRRISNITIHIRSEGLDDYRRSLPKMMTRAGLEGFMVAEEYIAFHIFSALAVLPVTAYLVFIVMGSSVATFIFLSLPIMLMIGLYPVYYLKRRIAERHKKIFRALPGALDLLTVSVEAGLDFMGGLNLVVEKGQPGPLRDEFSRMIKQMKLGVTRVDALREMSDRVGQTDLSSAIAALIQASTLGSSLGPILRIQARMMRERRSQIAEKLANEAPVKIIFPIVAFIFPSVFLVLLGPVLIKVVYQGDM